MDGRRESLAGEDCSLVHAPQLVRSVGFLVQRGRNCLARQHLRFAALEWLLVRRRERCRAVGSCRFNRLLIKYRRRCGNGDKRGSRLQRVAFRHALDKDAGVGREVAAVLTSRAAVRCERW